MHVQVISELKTVSCSRVGVTGMKFSGKLYNTLLGKGGYRTVMRVSNPYARRETWEVETTIRLVCLV